MTGRERRNAVLKKRPSDRPACTTVVDNASLAPAPEAQRADGGIGV